MPPVVRGESSGSTALRESLSDRRGEQIGNVGDHVARLQGTLTGQDRNIASRH